MKKCILLVNPPVLAVMEPWFDEPKFVRTALAHLAGYLRAHNDWEIRLVDAKFNRWDFARTAKEILDWAPDVVGLTAFTNEIKPAAYLAGLIKAQRPEIITVVGGAHLTAIPEQTLSEFPTFDIGVVGEGEETLNELCNAFAHGKGLNDVQGLVFRDPERGIVRTADRHRILDQNSLPLPAWDLFPAAEEYYIQTVRGCPFACTFCMNHNGRVARKSGVEKVIEEMEWLIETFKAKRISFGDELFSVDMVRTGHLLDAMIQHRIGERVYWDIQTHVAFVNEELLAKMKKANLGKIEMGVESGDMMVLKKMGKGTNEEMILKAFRSAKKQGLITGSFFIIGQPDETRKTIWNSLKLAIKINPTEPIFGSMVPYPGTDVAQMAAKGEGGYKLLTTDWDQYGKQLNGSMEIRGLSKAKLDRYQMLGYVIVFIANFRFLAFARFFWNYRKAAGQLLKKAFSGGGRVSMHKRPADYEVVINSQQAITLEQIAESREKWKKVQSTEMKYARDHQPELLKEQQPV